ncbi:hypothetical protein D0C36_04710 [Mucilaginibacter conchicola]|uniref:Uncharacterized protein n=1 Tax=Mucilaginibacter conchicola TaxID=2303333 RepID=A0A372NYU9_9SPHI|nr:hypothetical protein [Mucilaginibacter conchicola]RFZ94839.1 hypothetical protein D0C36_04710 [Mucilaginibacter conchicola]
MKIKLYLIVLAFISLHVACRPIDDVKPYDVTNKVFRVIAYYQNEPYNITINQIKPNAVNAAPYSILNTTQNANFEFGFTPAAGDTIKVNADSKTGSFTIFAHYLGKDLGKINLTPTNNGKHTAEFIYVVPN